jgi:hypothetical protein
MVRPARSGPCQASLTLVGGSELRRSGAGGARTHDLTDYETANSLGRSKRPGHVTAAVTGKSQPRTVLHPSSWTSLWTGLDLPEGGASTKSYVATPTIYADDIYRGWWSGRAARPSISLSAGTVGEEEWDGWRRDTTQPPAVPPPAVRRTPSLQRFRDAAARRAVVPRPRQRPHGIVEPTRWWSTASAAASLVFRRRRRLQRRPRRGRFVEARAVPGR